MSEQGVVYSVHMVPLPDDEVRWRCWNFTDKGGQWFRDGKSYYPDMVTLIIPRGRLLGLARQTLDLLAHDDGRDAEQITLFGELQSLTWEDANE